MISRLLSELRHLNDARLHPGIDAALITEVERDHGIAFPSDHRGALQTSNGVHGYAGYMRLFGLRTTESIDAIVWNQPDYWKFAWEGRCSEYWCFAETAWGDQYAYTLKSLRGGEAAPIHLLDALSMTPQVVAFSFKEFLEKEFVRSAKDPYDVMIKQARQKLGALEVSSHLVYVPSVLLGGVESIKHVQKMNARSAMICNGDIATQLNASPVDKAVKSVQPYEDELNRMRLRLVWT